MPNRASEILTKSLKSSRLRLTNERYLLLNEIMHIDGHFDADELFAKVKAKGLKSSRATVYNTLDLLIHFGLVSKYRFGENYSSYEKVVGRPRHDHLICTDCGTIIEVINEKLEKIENEICAEKNFKQNHATLQIFGTCSKCQVKLKRK